MGEAEGNNFGLGELKNISITENKCEKGTYELNIIASYEEIKPEFRYDILSCIMVKAN